MREKLGADVAQNTQADPRKIIDIQIGKKPAQNHNQRDEQAYPDHPLDARAVVRDRPRDKG